VEALTVTASARNTIEQMVELYLTDKKTQGLAADVIAKNKRELGRFADFMAGRGRLFPHEISQEDLTEFRGGWEERYPSSTTRSKVQERLRGFLRYCHALRLIDRIPHLTPIKVAEPPTMPLTDEQYAKLLSVIPDEFEAVKAERVRGLIQLMRYSGLAVGDAVLLERKELHKSGERYRVTTSRQKTDTHVSVLLPPLVGAEVLAAMKLNKNPLYAFWNTGTGKPQSAVTNWQHDLRQVFRAAGMEDGHPHQLRDTFAVDLLQKGVPLEQVSKLLGHESIKTTEKYYAKWVKSRQDRLDTLLIATFPGS